MFESNGAGDLENKFDLEISTFSHDKTIRLSSSFFDFNNSVQTTAVAAVGPCLFAAPTRPSHPTDPSNQPVRPNRLTRPT
ncbi:hypothetical protein BpHYR1_036896 [Brachionus plicatilis]|uniref:Uncharacterized protein n=1 Tax=Brachionus plicatilis TaxID=10195 RepID=A0A3M7R2T5_BRAPC|nr:hypothetical protein BpHYR1_036896 [Brachionus plicatilis]